MAKPTNTPAAGTGDAFTITQQGVNLLRQVVASTGWAKSIDANYLGGQILADVLPTLDSTDWVKTPAEVNAMTKAQRAAYTKRDEEWGAKPVEIRLTSKQQDVIKQAFEHVASQGALGPHAALNELFRALKLVKDE